MKVFKTLLHIWFTLISLLSFLGGWAILAHSRKPIQPSAQQGNSAVNFAPLPTLAPIQGLGNNFGNPGAASGLTILPSNPQPSTGFRSLRTGGS